MQLESHVVNYRSVCMQMQQKQSCRMLPELSQCISLYVFRHLLQQLSDYYIRCGPPI